MKKIILLLLTVIILCGCGLFQNKSRYEDDPLLEDLLDGNNTFMGITPGEDELIDAVKVMESYAIGETNFYESEKNGKISGMYKINYKDSFLKGVTVEYENEKIIDLIIQYAKPISIETILSELGSDFKISAYVVGLHESQLAIEFIYPEIGIEVNLEFLPIEEPIIQPDTEVFTLFLYATQTSFVETESFFISAFDVACARDWQGYGNVMTLYYPDADGSGCPYTIP